MEKLYKLKLPSLITNSIVRDQGTANIKFTPVTDSTSSLGTTLMAKLPSSARQLGFTINLESSEKCASEDFYLLNTNQRNNNEDLISLNETCDIVSGKLVPIQNEVYFEYMASGAVIAQKPISAYLYDDSKGQKSSNKIIKDVVEEREKIFGKSDITDAEKASSLKRIKKRKIVKLSNETLEDFILGFFDENNAYTLKELKTLTKQPVNDLKKVLNKICDFSATKDTFKKYTLKDKYK
eukprot:GAHX01001025.1.p1 GENE.GAHX01001025.1~~GAHX01001025.1.p1  ORF type:complete len:238 (-),score=57.81 GAHX01001025.1:49-762(-)